MRKGFVSLFFLFLIAFPGVFAHLSGGMDKEVNGYLVDIGYDPNPLFAQYPTMLSIGLLNATSKAPIDASKVWVRLATEEGVVYAGTHILEHGFAPISMTLPKGGEYTLSVRFYDNDGPKSIASVDFPLTIKEDVSSSDFFDNSWAVLFLFSGMIVAGIIGYIIGIAVMTRKDSKKLK